MRTTRLSTKGQIVIPREVREQLGWEPGLELEVRDEGNSILIRPAGLLEATTLADLQGCVQYDGPALSVEDMDAAVAAAAREAESEQ